MSDTPETGEVFLIEGNWNTFAKQLKRERDEAREQIKELIYIGGRAIALADIDLENDKFGVVSELRSDLEKIKEGAK